MNKIAGYILMMLGTIGMFFFIAYHGSVIPLKELWFVLSLTVAIAGSYFIAKNTIRNSKLGAVDDGELLRIQDLKSTGEKVSFNTSEL